MVHPKYVNAGPFESEARHEANDRHVRAGENTPWWFWGQVRTFYTKRQFATAPLQGDELTKFTGGVGKSCLTGGLHVALQFEDISARAKTE